MSEKMEALARRAVACPGWRWMAGAAADMPDGNRARLLMDGKWWCPPLSNHEAFVAEEETLPDLTDPATLGCLLALVREAWGESFAGVGVVWFGGHGEWCVVDGDARLMAHAARVLARGRTEAAALVAALEAAPAKVAP